MISDERKAINRANWPIPYNSVAALRMASGIIPARRNMELHPVALAAAACIVFLLAAARVSGLSFLNFDDPVYVTARDQVRGGLTWAGVRWALTSLEIYWQPLTWLSHMADVELFGMNAAAHHVTSVAVHGLASSLLFLWLRRLGGGLYMCVSAAALWALHPLRVESVAWIADRKDGLSGVFGLLTLLAWRGYSATGNAKSYLLAILAFCLALMSKPTMVALPLGLMVLDYWPAARARDWRTLIGEKLPFFALAGGVAWVTFIGAGESGAFALNPASGMVRFENAVVTVVTYLAQIAFPMDSAAYYPMPLHIPLYKTAGAAAIILLISVTAIRERNRRPYLLAGWLWYLLFLVPVIGLVQAGSQARADRFTYWPAIGITWATVWFASDWLNTHPAWRQRTVWITALVLAMLAARSWHQTGYWRNSQTLFEHSLAITGDNEYALALLGGARMDAGQFASAETSLVKAITLAPDSALHHFNLSVVLLNLSRFQEAEREAGIAVRLKPREGRFYESLITAALRLNKPEEAVSHLERAGEAGYDAGKAAAQLNDAGARFAQRGAFSNAEPLFREALRLNPNLLAAHKNLAMLLVATGRSEHAGDRIGPR